MKILNLIILCIISILLMNCAVSHKVNYQFTNSLIKEKSPYLLQHAHNPVNWTAWNDISIENAKKQNKLLFISIGFSACHWCHVMEKESFADTSIAFLLNQNYSSIKIDREERPDIDQVYMTACQLTNSEGCGWPLNVIAFPDGRPIWLGSYLTKDELKSKLNYFLNAKNKNVSILNQYAEFLKENILVNQNTISKKNDSVDINLEKVIQVFHNQLDTTNGGLNQTPKFTMPVFLKALIDFEQIKPNLKKEILLSLDKMASGGVYDQLGGGFARYSTNADWSVPHFEKMLSDNAQMISLYARAFHVYKIKNYKKIVIETIDFLEQNFKSKKGGFYTSSDADSNGQEGLFYVWTKKEIENILGQNATLFINYYSILENGNWINNQNILMKNQKYVNVSNDILIDNLKLELLKTRNQRIQPNIDTKIICSSNAMMLKAYLDAYRFLGDEKYLKSAINLANFINQKLINNTQIKHQIDGSDIGFLDDYVFTIDAFIELYQLSFEKKWLIIAKELVGNIEKNFELNEQGFFMYSKTNNLFVNSESPIYDGILPSSNAVLANAYFNLGIIFQNENYSKRSIEMTETVLKNLSSINYIQHYYWLNLFQKQKNLPLEISILGANAKKQLAFLMPNYNAIFMGSKSNDNLPMLNSKFKKNKTMIYVCKNNHCLLPTEDAKEAEILIKKFKK